MTIGVPRPRVMGFALALVLMSAGSARLWQGRRDSGRGDLDYPATTRLQELAPRSNHSVPLRFANRGARSIRIVGFEASCRESLCIAVDGLPRTVPERCATELTLKVKTLERLGPFVEEALFYTDDPREPRVIIRLAGVIRAVDGSPGSIASREEP